MTTDLWMLVWTALLALFFPFTYLIGRMQVPGGVDWAFRNRETPLAGLPEWAARAQRTHANLVENLGPFAMATGATLFFWGRVAHAAAYIAGIVYLRTAVFFLAMIGELLILWRILA